MNPSTRNRLAALLATLALTTLPTTAGAAVLQDPPQTGGADSGGTTALNSIVDLITCDGDTLIPWCK